MATTDAELAKLSVQLELQTAAFEDGVKRMDRQLKRMENNTKRSSAGIDKLNDKVKSLGKGIAGLASVATLGFLANATKEALEYADSIAKTAEKVGVTTAELQELRFAASQAGIESRTLDMALQRFARRMGEAAQGTGELLKTTQELGIQFRDSDGRFFSTVELLDQYAEAMGKATTQQEKLRLAFKAFDSEGAALVNLLGNGSEEMRKLRQEAQDLGLVMSNETTQVAEELSDQLDILATVIKTKLNSQLVMAGYGIARLFGGGTAAGDVAYFTQKISDAEAELAGLQKIWEETGDRGRPFIDEGRIRQLASQISQYMLKLRELGVEYERTSEAAKNNPIGPTVEQQQQFDRAVEKLIKDANPYNELAEKLGLIDEALRRVTDPAIRENLYALREAIEFGEPLEDSLSAIEKFELAVTSLLSETDSVKAMDDLAAKLGVIDAAIKRTTDPAQLEKLFALREALEFGEILDPPKIDKDLEEIKRAIDGFARDFTNTLVDGLKTGELAFDDFAKNVLETIVKMMLNDLFTQFFELIYGGIKTYFGFGTAPTTSTDPARQGMTRAGEASTAMVGMVQGYAAPRSYDSKSRVTVNVNNYGNDDVSVSERQDSNGGIDIDVLIKSKVSKGFARGDYDKVMGSTFGVRRLGY